MIFIYFLQNLTIIIVKKHENLTLLIFLESLIHHIFFNNEYMDILTRGNDSSDYVAIHIYIIC